MTNVEIIAAAKMLNGITEEAHTFAAWKARGFSVRKGERAAFSTKIWKYKPANKEDKDTEGHMFMKTAHFFTESQVDKIA